MITELCEDPKISLDTVVQGAKLARVMDKTIQVRMPVPMYKELAKLAKNDRRTLSNYVRLLIERAVSHSNAA